VEGGNLKKSEKRNEVRPAVEKKRRGGVTGSGREAQQVTRKTLCTGRTNKGGSGVPGKPPKGKKGWGYDPRQGVHHGEMKQKKKKGYKNKRSEIGRNTAGGRKRQKCKKPQGKKKRNSAKKTPRAGSRGERYLG